MNKDIKIHKNLSKEIYPFVECTFCDQCIPEADSMTNSSTQCDRCTMNKSPDRFIPNFKSDNEEDLEEALSALVELQQYKNRNGKTALYKQARVNAWKVARGLVNNEY